MSTEHYFYCHQCNHKVHFGTRYASGFRMFTIGANQEETTKWLDEHVFCSDVLQLVNEHFDEEDLIPEPEYGGNK